MAALPPVQQPPVYKGRPIEIKPFEPLSEVEINALGETEQMEYMFSKAIADRAAEEEFNSSVGALSAADALVVEQEFQNRAESRMAHEAVADFDPTLSSDVIFEDEEGEVEEEPAPEGASFDNLVAESESSLTSYEDWVASQQTTPPADSDVPLGGDASRATDVHVVEEGDDLLSIAAYYNILPRDVAAANDLELGDEISVGQRILIPSREVEEEPVVEPLDRDLLQKDADLRERWSKMSEKERAEARDRMKEEWEKSMLKRDRDDAQTSPLPTEDAPVEPPSSRVPKKLQFPDWGAVKKARPSQDDIDAVIQVKDKYWKYDTNTKKYEEVAGSEGPPILEDIRSSAEIRDSVFATNPEHNTTRRQTSVDRYLDVHEARMSAFRSALRDNPEVLDEYNEADDNKKAKIFRYFMRNNDRDHDKVYSQVMVVPSQSFFQKPAQPRGKGYTRNVDAQYGELLDVQTETIFGEFVRSEEFRKELDEDSFIMLAELYAHRTRFMGYSNSPLFKDIRHRARGISRNYARRVELAGRNSDDIKNVTAFKINEGLRRFALVEELGWIDSDEKVLRQKSRSLWMLQGEDAGTAQTVGSLAVMFGGYGALYGTMSKAGLLRVFGNVSNAKRYMGLAVMGAGEMGLNAAVNPHGHSLISAAFGDGDPNKPLSYVEAVAIGALFHLGTDWIRHLRTRPRKQTQLLLENKLSRQNFVLVDPPKSAAGESAAKAVDDAEAATVGAAWAKAGEPQPRLMAPPETLALPETGVLARRENEIQNELFQLGKVRKTKKTKARIEELRTELREVSPVGREILENNARKEFFLEQARVNQGKAKDARGVANAIDDAMGKQAVVNEAKRYVDKALDFTKKAHAIDDLGMAGRRGFGRSMQNAVNDAVAGIAKEQRLAREATVSTRSVLNALEDMRVAKASPIQKAIDDISPEHLRAMKESARSVRTKALSRGVKPRPKVVEPKPAHLFPPTARLGRAAANLSDEVYGTIARFGDRIPTDAEKVVFGKAIMESSPPRIESANAGWQKFGDEKSGMGSHATVVNERRISGTDKFVTVKESKGIMEKRVKALQELRKTDKSSAKEITQAIKAQKELHRDFAKFKKRIESIPSRKYGALAREHRTWALRESKAMPLRSVKSTLATAEELKLLHSAHEAGENVVKKALLKDPDMARQLAIIGGFGALVGIDYAKSEDGTYGSQAGMPVFLLGLGLFNPRFIIPGGSRGSMFFGSSKGLTKKILRRMSNRLRAIHPMLEKLAMGHECRVGGTIHSLKQVCKPFRDGLQEGVEKGAITLDEANEFAGALTSRGVDYGTRRMVSDMSKKIAKHPDTTITDPYDLANRFVEMVYVKNKLRDEALAVGMDVGWIEDHWPRAVKPDLINEFNAAMGITNQTRIDRAVKEFKDWHGRNPTKKEKIIIGNTVAGENTLGLKSVFSKVDFGKARKLGSKDAAKFSRFYKSPFEALDDYIESMVHEISKRKLYGGGVDMPKTAGILPGNILPSNHQLNHTLGGVLSQLRDTDKWLISGTRVYYEEGGSFVLSRDMKFKDVFSQQERRIGAGERARLAKTAETRELITEAQEDEVLEMFAARFASGQQEMPALWSFLRSTTRIMNLGQFTSTIVQLTDMGITAATEGGRITARIAAQRTAKEASDFKRWATMARNPNNKVHKDLVFTMEDFNLTTIGAEVFGASARTKGVAPLVEKFADDVHKFTRFRATDALGKEVKMNATLLEMRENVKGHVRSDGKVVVNRISEKFRKDWEEAFGSDFHDLVGAVVKKDWANWNLRTAIFMKLGRVQPITMFNMPQAYVEAGGFGRFMYSLKTFQLTYLNRQYDAIISKIARGIAKRDWDMVAEGGKNMVKLFVYFGGAGFGTLTFIDFLKGKPFDPMRSGYDALYQTIGTSRYQIGAMKRAMQRGDWWDKTKATAEILALPPTVSNARSLGRDLNRIFDGKPISELEIFRFIPVVGLPIKTLLGDSDTKGPATPSKPIMPSKKK